jgi:hypothetical protein
MQDGAGLSCREWHPYYGDNNSESPGLAGYGFTLCAANAIPSTRPHARWTPMTEEPTPSRPITRSV